MRRDAYSCSSVVSSFPAHWTLIGRLEVTGIGWCGNILPSVPSSLRSPELPSFHPFMRPRGDVSIHPIQLSCEVYKCVSWCACVRFGRMHSILGALAITFDGFGAATREMEVCCWNRSHVEAERLIMVKTVIFPKRMLVTGAARDRVILPCIEREAGGGL